MRLFFFTLLTVVLCSHSLWGQNESANLLAQSPDGKTVKLVWFLKSAPGDVPGFDIKRKDGLGDWHTLNAGALLPGISMKKNLTQFESDNVEVTRIKEKLKDLLRTGKIHEYDYNTFVEKWKNNDKEIKDIMNLVALDFDLSVISGFGFVDHTVTQKIDYQYGLFIHGTNTLLGKATWNYGEIPDLDVVKGITSKSSPGKKGVQLIWNADVNKIKTSYVAGFNVYKRGIRLNDRPINSRDPGDPSEYVWNDASANSTVSDQYSISAESLFGIEGIIRSYTYNPADHPSDYKRAVVTQISSLGFYFKDGISIDWTFPKDQEHFIRGFYIEKDNMPDGYRRVSDLITPESRDYIDKTASPVSSPIRIRVTAVYNDKTLNPGIERLYSYFPILEPPRPQNTRVSLAMENKKLIANISWEPVMNGDSATHLYKVYLLGSASNAPDLLAEKLTLKQTSFRYSTPPGISALYRFFVIAVGRSGAESVPGDTVSVTAPSTELPAPSIGKTTIENGKVTIQWQFPEITDVVGFRLYNDATMIADEKVLKKNAREFTTSDLLPGSINNFTVRAITEKGIIGEASAAAAVTIPALKN